jgi:hypothetical protein
MAAAVLVLAWAMPLVGLRAQDVELTMSAGEGLEGFVSLRNRLQVPVKVANVQVRFLDARGQEHQFDHDAPLDVTLGPGEETDVAVSFRGAGEGWRLADYDRALPAVGLDIDRVAGPAEAALAGGQLPAIREALVDLRRDIAPVSRAYRLQRTALERTPGLIEAWYDFPRLDGLVTSMENFLCEEAGQRIMQSGAATRQRAYETVGAELRDIGLHVNCMSAEARLTMARTLIDGNRPQDALVFRSVDSEGNLLPEWRPIVIEASLAFAQAAVNLRASEFRTLRPALEALNDVHDLEPEDARLTRLADAMIPLVADWASRATEPPGIDMDGAQDAITLLRPRWDRYPQVMEAAGRLATIRIQRGMELCQNREWIASRNEFVRGERVLAGVPAWDEQAPQINHCRALGTLQEGRDMASDPQDLSAVRRSIGKLDEALSRYALSDEEIRTFREDIAASWVAVALREMSQRRMPGAHGALMSAEEVAQGPTDAVREGWLAYAEHLLDAQGLMLSDTDVERIREALQRGGEVDPDRSATIASRITLGYWGLRAGLPIGLLFAALGALGWAWAGKARAQRLARLAEEDLL